MNADEGAAALFRAEALEAMNPPHEPDRVEDRLRLPRWPVLVSLLSLGLLITGSLLTRVPVSGVDEPLLFAMLGWGS
ncbi:hypothetical protein [Amycolatopsis sp. 195334CR]|uniref:hypothetical protein n=1 Tax=Amycolatopsis sp. 195334CR TaxID=2814588 RepID=UPI001A8FAC3C|nr:hypothetical protein [Amycolatopsis sp. 195334CR]MBN6033678.1 hypothetical protein [Amycolatopsis sp. 195334CR]